MTKGHNAVEHEQYHLPVIPYGPIDALNRRAAALGSPSYAQKSAHADHNGHAVTVSWNDFRGYYVAQYYWAGRTVISRGSFGDCLSAALREHGRGALGSSLSVAVRPGDSEALAECHRLSLVPGPLPRRLEWWTWRHDVAVESVKDHCFPNVPTIIFDWEIAQKAADRAAYEQAIGNKYGLLYR